MPTLQEDIDLERTREWNPETDVPASPNVYLDQQVVYKGYAFHICEFRCQGSLVDGHIYASRIITNPRIDEKAYDRVHLRKQGSAHSTWSSIDQLKQAIANGEVYAH